MTVTEAARLLDLPPEATPAQIQTRYHLLRNRLQEKLDAATSSFLVERHRTTLTQITAAYELLSLAAEVSGTAPGLRQHKDEAAPAAVVSKPSGPRRSDDRASTASSGEKSSRAVAVASGMAPAAARDTKSESVPKSARTQAVAVAPAAPAAPTPSPSVTAIKAESGGKAVLWIAVVALLLAVAGGGWWFFKGSAAKAERVRIAAEMDVELSALSQRWAALQADLATAQQARADILAEQGRANVLAVTLQAELSAREKAQAAYIAWATESLDNQSIPSLLKTLGEQIQAGQHSQAVATRTQLEAGLAQSEQLVPQQRATLLALGRSAEIASTPSGLPYVIVDAYGNRREGLTPASLELPWGSARLTVSPPSLDWGPYSRELLVTRELPPEARAVFTYTSARITSSPEGLAFTLRGAGAFSTKGVTPANLSRVPSGPVVLTVSRPGWRDVVQKTEIPQEGLALLTAAFTPGSVVLRSEPSGASVALDGKTIGLTPLEVKDLPPGEYRYRLSLAGHADGLVTGKVEAGTATEITLALDKATAVERGKPYRVPSLGLTLMPIRAGLFIMGSSESEAGHDTDETRRQVRLTRDFWLGQYEVTQAEWRDVMGTSPSYFTGDRLPVEQVSWSDAMDFCRRLTERERAAGRLPVGLVYTLPTEAQWEYACRAGTTSAYGGTGSLDEMGWHRDSSRSQTNEVGLKPANAWGLHDMHGNVWEWCRDWFGFYEVLGIVDPSGPADGNGRVNRGGGWGSAGTSCRSAFRFNSAPESRINNLGFRLALVEEPTAK